MGHIVRRAAGLMSGNPRELKRLANLARLCLQLRDKRRENESDWIAPSLDQYARWIALTLKWPDMMRWLQWGGDEAGWTADEATRNLVARRLAALENGALGKPDVKEWFDSVSVRLKLSEDCEWLRDPNLFDFFRGELDAPPERRLSAAADREFW